MSQRVIDIEIDLKETEEKLEFFEEKANRFGTPDGRNVIYVKRDGRSGGIQIS